MTSLRAALIQTRTPATQAASLEQLRPLVDEAVAAGAHLIATPEASNFLQRSKTAFAEVVTDAEHDAVVQAAQSWARQHGVWFLLGSALVKRGDGLFANRSMLFSPDGLAAQYDKIHMFDVDLPTGERHRESAVYAPGEAAVVAETPFGKIGMTVCYDVRFPQLYRALAKSGAAILTVPAAFTRPTGEAHWSVLLRARAIENGAFVLAPAQGGFHEDGRGTYGHSMIIAPWGEVLAEAPGDEPGVIVADLDLEAVAKARGAVPSLANERPFAAPKIAT
jgi:deaminated glutathione amidase